MKTEFWICISSRHFWYRGQDNFCLLNNYIEKLLIKFLNWERESCKFFNYLVKKIIRVFWFLTCCILCRSFLSNTPVTNCTSPRMFTCGSLSAAKSSTRRRFIDKPAMTPAKGRSIRDLPLRFIFPPTWIFDIELKVVAWWPVKTPKENQRC